MVGSTDNQLCRCSGWLQTMIEFIRDLIEIYESKHKNPDWKKAINLDGLVGIAYQEGLITKKEVSQYLEFTHQTVMVNHAIEYSLKLTNTIDKSVIDQYLNQDHSCLSRLARMP